MALRKDQRALLLAATLAAALWTVPELRIFVLPLVYYNTHVHELCHALAAIATGGGVQQILVFANGSGVAQIMGGWTPVVASAGYVGSTMVGGLVLAWAKNESGARQALGAAAMFLGLSLVLFVRGDGIGLLSAAGWLVALILAAARTRGAATLFLAQFLGLQLCLTSLQSFASLFYVAAHVDGHSDAKILEQATGVPDVLWASSWLVLSLLVVWAGLRAAWRPAKRAP
ncbi:MAG: M50 family metallopeptidase [Fimbriimonadaceae bacterium]|nr:M50 family metallopeptidase [Fimbriimonadaceae bacterium]QYK57992.1 MAG: M50 family metallopeptidase [Fimbriimonadaceae bacterium]